MKNSSVIFEDSSFSVFSFRNRVLDDLFSSQILEDIQQQICNYKMAYGGKLWADLQEVEANTKSIIDSFSGLKDLAYSKDFLCNLSQNWSASHSSLKQKLAEKHEINPKEILGEFSYDTDSSQLLLVAYRETKNHLNKNIVQKIDDFPLRCRIQISRMPERSVILPHTDASAKIASIMLYLPTSLQQEESSLGTIFWKKKSNVTVKQKETSYLSGKEYSKFSQLYEQCRTPFEGSRLIYFFRSDRSWHSFQHDHVGIGERISVNMNFLLS